MSEDIVTNYRKVKGNRAEELLEFLGKIHPTVQAWKSPLGQQILKYDTNKLAALLEKQVKDRGKMPESELIEIGIYHDRIVWLMNLMEQYDKGTKEIKRDGKR